jgi:hypothetical protein
MERLNLPGFEFLVKDPIIEPRLALGLLDEPLDDNEDGYDRRDDQDDRPKMLAHVVVKPFYPLEARRRKEDYGRVPCGPNRNL